MCHLEYQLSVIYKFNSCVVFFSRNSCVVFRHFHCLGNCLGTFLCWYVSFRNDRRKRLSRQKIPKTTQLLRCASLNLISCGRTCGVAQLYWKIPKIRRRIFFKISRIRTEWNIESVFIQMIQKYHLTIPIYFPTVVHHRFHHIQVSMMNLM